MSTLTDPLKTILIQAADRSEARHWARNLSQGALSQEELTEKVSTVFREQSLAPMGRDMVGANLLNAMVQLGNYLSSTTPTDAELSALIEIAKTDYVAFQVLEFMCQLSKNKPYPCLTDWEQKRYLGLIMAPPVPRGQNPTKFAHRDQLIIGQIEALVSLGLSATRNSAAKHADSACDVGVSAFARLGTYLSYAAVEAVWKNKNRNAGMMPTAYLFANWLLSQTNP